MSLKKLLTRPKLNGAIIKSDMKKILILGSNGMLGQYCVDLFGKDSDYEVIESDRQQLDITKEETILPYIKEVSPDIILNCAAMNAVDNCETDQLYLSKAKYVNGYSVGYIAKACNELDIDFVHISTDYVFDGTHPDGYNEDFPTTPINNYSYTKNVGENEARANTNKLYIVRTSRLFGKQGVGDDVKQSFVDLMIDLAEKQDVLHVINDETSCPTYAKDLAQQIKYILDNKLEYGNYHAVNVGACTWHGLAQDIFSILDKKVELDPVAGTYFARPAARPKSTILLNTKLPELRSYQDALKEYLLEKDK